MPSPLMRRISANSSSTSSGERPSDGSSRMSNLGSAINPRLVEELFALIRRINGEGIALLLVEQNVVQCLEVARRAYILEKGIFVLHGNSADIRDDPNLKRAYLGL